MKAGVVDKSAFYIEQHKAKIVMAVDIQQLEKDKSSDM